MKRKAQKEQPPPVVVPKPSLEQMRAKTGPVNVKLTFTEHAFLEKLVKAGHYGSKSGAFRAGLGVIFQKHKITPEEEAQIERERRFHYPRRRRPA